MKIKIRTRHKILGSMILLSALSYTETGLITSTALITFSYMFYRMMELLEDMQKKEIKMLNEMLEIHKAEFDILKNRNA